MRKHIGSVNWLILSFILLLTDIFSKKWAETVLAPVREIPWIDGVIGFRYAENTGAAFSAFSGSTLLLGVVSLAVCASILIYILRHPGMNWLTNLSLSMLLAGGTGNLIDRFCRGYVVDFFEFQFVDFAVFNVADIYITTGAVLLFLALLFGGEHNGRLES